MTISAQALNYLTAGIQAEIAAYVFYKIGADKVGDEDIKRTMLHFAGEERKHFLTLEHQYDQHVRSEKWVTYRDIMNKDALPTIDEAMGEKHVKRIAEVKAAKSKQAILAIALQLEKEAYAMYSEAAKTSTEADIKKTFEYLTQFEMGHIRNVEAMMAEK
ncbi:MAG: ferritin family protein [candidate division Zixibacteria bacterium]|nr:ferritin family protein [candidate division Zixibacteria bacterium]